MKKQLTLQEFIEKAKVIHGNKFDYSKVVYNNNKTKVCIICPIHGEFLQTPANHLSGNDCVKCRNKRNSELNLFTLKEFITKSNIKHNNFYDYSKVVYKGKRDIVIIICPIHGEFEQLAGNHLQGSGCPKCFIEKFIQNHPTRLTTEEFIQRSILIHGDIYDYSKVVYFHSRNKVIIKCKKHGDFEQVASDHLRGCGCPICNFSKGEKTLQNIFKKYNIKTKSQFMLPFYTYEYDFYLPDYNLLIEFHGIQHYQPIGYFGGVETFKKILERDAFKRSLAREYRIPLIEFNYKNFINMSNEKFEQLVLKTIKKYKKSYD